MKKWIYLMALFILFSCTKFGKNLTIKGRAYNPATGEGIAGVTFSLQKGTLGWNGGYKTVKTATSDENGNFELSALSLSAEQIMGDPVGFYSIGWVNPETGKQIGGNYTMQIKKGKTMHADFQAVPYGYLKLSIHNVNCQGPTDTMVLEKYYNTTISSDYGFYPVEFYGCYDDSTPPPVKIPAGNWELTWTATKSGVTTNGSVTIQVAGGQTTEYTLNY